MHVTILNHFCTSTAKLHCTKITINLGVSIQFLPCDAVATCLSVLNTVMMLCSRTYHLLLVTEFPHSTFIGSHILPVLLKHIPAFSLPHFIRIESRIPALLHFTNILSKEGSTSALVQCVTVASLISEIRRWIVASVAGYFPSTV